MQYGYIIPDVTREAIDDIVGLAREAEGAGWDAVFFWDADWGQSPWVVLAAMAMQTERVRLGAILHPLAWREPWLFARDAATLDQLARGRLTISIGLGAVDEADMARGRTRFGMPTDRATRAQRIDEGLEIVTGLWGGEPFSFHGAHYHMDAFQLTPTPAQSPRIPIWAVGVWGRPKSMARVARCDGMLLSPANSPEETREIAAYIAARRTLTSPFDLVMEADTRADTPEAARDKVRAWAEAGVSWWVESMWSPGLTIDDARRRIAQGPPRI
jgi:alkanesulfonate monooxygenase SsuD/methylene tetrahydromethanopterin reductase-like flavin-dependent oxidoreductase (luciferase family)